MGQSLSAMHCTHPGVAIVPQSTGLAPPSPPLAPPEEPLEVPVEPSPGVPLDVPLELPPDELLAAPLDEPLSEEPPDDPEPPSGLLPVVLPLQPTATAMESAMARPRQLFNDDMAGLLSKLPRGSRSALAAEAALRRGIDETTPVIRPRRSRAEQPAKRSTANRQRIDRLATNLRNLIRTRDRAIFTVILAQTGEASTPRASPLPS